MQDLKCKKSLTSFPIMSMFCWTWGTHCLKMANNSDTEVLGSKRISWHDVSLGSKKENSEIKKVWIKLKVPNKYTENNKQ